MSGASETPQTCVCENGEQMNRFLFLRTLTPVFGGLGDSS